MKIVIEIADCVWNRLKNKDCDMGDGNYLLCAALENGIPLPKWHGDLIDKKELKKKLYRIDDSATLSTRDVVNEEDIDDAPTLIPADENCRNDYELAIENMQYCDKYEPTYNAEDGGM